MTKRHEPVTIAGVTYPCPYKAAVVLAMQTGIPEETLRMRISRGYADKWILFPGRLSCRACTDHTGREFPTFRAMCAAWGKRYITVAKRLERGATIERALTEPSRWTRRHEGRIVADHTGRWFPSVNAMCAAWGVERRTFNYRLAAGWSQERALTEQSLHEHPAIRMPRQDHTGREFPTAEAMCLAWGQTSRRVRGRLRCGWTLEQALTAPSRVRRGGDHGL